MERARSTRTHQLSPLDAIFLALETPETPAHVGGLVILDGHPREKYDFSLFRDFVAERIARCPRFGWRVHEVPFGLDLPYWVDDEALDFNAHVRRAALPAPGGAEELADAAGHLFGMPLDRSRPLWEMYWIEGVQGDHVALLWKVHHCLMDGESGANLMELLFDVTPEPVAGAAEAPSGPELDARPRRDAAAPGAPAWNDVVGRSIRNSLTRSARLSQTVIGAVGSSFARRNEARDPLWSTPRTSFNGAVGSRRKVAWASVPIDSLKAIKRELGVTVNDVILGLTGGAIRSYLEDRGELPAAPLKALVPVSTRREGDKSIGNQIRDVSVDWGTDLSHPVERILRIHHDTARAKQEVALGSDDLINRLAEALPPAAHRLLVQAGVALTQHIPLPANAVVSNVRMPQIPFYVAGARIIQTIPISVLAPTQGLNFTAMSYCDEVFFGITADPRLVPDPWIIAQGTSKALFDLQAAVKHWSSGAAD